MYIANRPLSAGYKIFTALIAWVSLWFLVRDYQGSSVQFLATFVALLSGVYFLAAAFKVLFGHRHHPWRAFCPVWHGALLLGALLVLTTQVVASAFPAAAILTPTGVGGLIASLVLPLLIIFDWALFSAKGHWRLIDSWYWLCLPLIYLAINYLIIGATVSSEPLVYPYGFLDYLALGVIPTLIWIGGIMVGCLVLGFLLAGSDRAFRSRETTTSAKSTTKATTKAAISVPTEAPTAATTSVPAEAPTAAATSVPTATPAETTTSAPPEPAAEVTDQPASPSDQTAPDQPTDSDHATPENQSETAAPAAQSKSSRTSNRKLVDVRPSTKSRRQPTGRKATKAAAGKATATAAKSTKSATKSTKSASKPASTKTTKSISSKSAKSPKSASTHSAAGTATDTKSTRSLHGRTQVGD